MSINEKEIGILDEENTIFVPLIFYKEQTEPNGKIWDYFYTEQEVRKLKLEQLENG